MSFKTYIEYLRGLIQSIPFNIFDYIIFVTLLLYIFEDIAFGLIPAAAGLAATLLSFFAGLVLYPHLSSLIVEKFSLTKGISDATSFLITTLVSFVLISGALSIARRRYISVKFSRKIDIAGGAVAGSLSFFFIASFAVALLLSFPISPIIKDSIRNSVTGRFLFIRTAGMEREVRKVFGGAIEETINFLTIRPQSQESIRLNFRIASFKIDPKSEEIMLGLVNSERSKKGLSPLSQDVSLKEVARSHAKDMLERGYFSHYTLEGLS
ncbi:MAG: CvpA family protein, partial [Candidatus Levybacteria bacterium]|nr:CvpA family protein [Candidatus Levybacteria bacterium]